MSQATRVALPRPLTSFIGRERELAEARRLLEKTRLLTLTGPGGSGKTRLSIELARGQTSDFPDGIYFVPLAPVRDPGLVASTIAGQLDLPEAAGRSLPELLAQYLRERRTLLVLDNFEHVASAASLLAGLLAETELLRLLVSSRSALHVSGEQECPVPPLEVREGVRLFTDRAQAADPGFAADDVAVAEIVRRLDGLPLALELAAARVKLLPPAAILTRLEDSLGLLTGGGRDLPDRQRTLRATIAWSYDLLSPGAQGLLDACSVFRGGASLALVEQVCAPFVVVRVLDGLQELVDQSLMRLLGPGGEARYGMLETIREFAGERLAKTPEAKAIRAVHAAAFASLAQQARRELTGPREKEWLDRLELEHNNLRAAIDWLRGDAPEKALATAADLSRFWGLRGHFAEGRTRLRDLLRQVPERTETRVRALTGAGSLATDQGDYDAAASLLGEALELSRDLGDRLGEGIASQWLARNDIANLRFEAAAPHVERAITLLEEAGYLPGLALAMQYAGLRELFSGRPDSARVRFEQAIRICRDIGYRSVGARLQQQLATAMIELGDLRGARAALETGLPTSIDIGDTFPIPVGLTGFAGLAARTGRPRLALRLAGAAMAFSEAREFAMPRPLRALLDRWLGPARQQLKGEADRIFTEGRQMTLAEAVALALANTPEEAWRPGPRRTLTNRELQVTALVASGLTNREVAERLYLSVRTVDVHVDHILTKLAFHTRTQLVAWAYEQGLLPKNT